jgi:uncharacterized membrane protein
LPSFPGLEAGARDTLLNIISSLLPFIIINSRLIIYIILIFINIKILFKEFINKLDKRHIILKEFK